MDFPDPLGPISPIRSPSDTVNEMFWKSGVSPNFLEIPLAFIIGGKVELILSLVGAGHCAGSRGPDDEKKIVAIHGLAVFRHDADHFIELAGREERLIVRPECRKAQRAERLHGFQQAQCAVDVDYIAGRTNSGSPGDGVR